jgi:hypothetical protein
MVSPNPTQPNSYKKFHRDVERREHTGGEGHVTVGTDIEETCLQPRKDKGYWQPPVVTRYNEGSSTRAIGGNMALQTSGFQSSSLQNKYISVF